MTRAIYRVLVRPSSDVWSIEVPDAGGTQTEVQHLEDAELAARAAVALTLGVSESDFDVELFRQM